MRFEKIGLFLGALAGLVAAQAREPQLQGNPHARSTYFDGVEVPPLWEMVNTDVDFPREGQNKVDIEAELNQTKYMMVKYTSPFCTYCMRFAPTFQTFYEFYYTSGMPANAERLPNQTDATTFGEYYDFRFASVDCIVNVKFCQKQNINSYPRTLIYRYGEVYNHVLGGKDMRTLMYALENTLWVHYKDRPYNGDLPAPGAASRPVSKETPKAELTPAGDEEAKSQKPIGASEAH